MNVSNLIRTIRCLVALSILFLIPGVSVAAYPDRVIRFVVGFSAGGITDVMARTLARRMSVVLGQPIIIENRPGVDSLIATKFVAEAERDGYTILVASGSHTINVSLYPDTKVDPVKDFAPIGLFGDAANFLVVNPSVQAKSIEELVALARKNPGKLNYASVASTAYLATELFLSTAGIKATSIPYKGSGPAVPALLSGQVDFAMIAIGTLLPHVKNGTLRALGITGAARFALAPDIPTINEKGVPGYIYSTWYGLLAPAGTPRDIVQLLSVTLRKVVQEPAVRATFDAQGVEPTLNYANSPEEFEQFIRADVIKWAKVVKDTGWRPQ